MTQRREKQVVKKVQPYPFSGHIEGSAGPKTELQVIKITSLGLLVLLKGHILKVGGIHTIFFSLPVTGSTIHTQVRVIKTYDRVKASSPSQISVERMVEMHFLKLNSEQKTAIHNFTTLIGQH